MVDFSLNRCHSCGKQLPPDDFDAICNTCENKPKEKPKTKKKTKLVYVTFDIEINSNVSDVDTLAWLKFELFQASKLPVENPLINEPLSAVRNSITISHLDTSVA